MKKLFFLNILFACHLLCGNLTAIAQGQYFATTKKDEGVCPNHVTYLILPKDLLPNQVFKGVPKNLKYTIGCLDFQKEQTVFEKYRAGMPLKDEEFDVLYNTDTTQLSSQPTKHQLFIMVYFEGQKKVMVVDSNMNQDFSDDEILKFDKVKDAESFKRMVIRYEFVENGKIFEKQTTLKVKPFHKQYIYKDVVNGKYYTAVELAEFVRGEISVKGKTYYFAAKSLGPKPTRYEGFNLRFGTTDFSSSDKFGAKDLKSNGDTLDIDGAAFTPKFSTFGDTFYLEPAVVHYRHLFDELTKYKTLNGTLLNMADLTKYDYTIIDFWGTWCGPCVKDLPKMQELYHKFQSKNLNLIGIAVDADEQKVMNFVKKQKLTNSILFEKMNDQKTGLYGLLNIQVFPTYMILDKAGTIIHTSNSFETLEAAIGKLMED
ncbi:MAG: TlpA family protein disulfide reductase [Saprospiraceae bacterium]|nr:TlpA family protein disulfide reductase [Saprospiraceae bacterium]